MREDDGSWQWFKEYVDYFEHHKLEFVKDPAKTYWADKLIVLWREFLEEHKPKKEKYSWEK